MAGPGKVAQGSRVAVHYTGSLDDGTLFDSSEGREPLEFTVGEGEVIPGFERAVMGLGPGEERTVRLGASEAYGDYDASLVIEGPKDKFPADLKEGQSFHVHLQGGQDADAVVKEVRAASVVLDFNHPLAGKDLTFRVKVVRVD